MGNTGWSDFLELINPEFKRPISTFPPSSSAKFFTSIVFSDGRLLTLESSFEDDKVTLRDVLTGKSIAPLPRWGRVEGHVGNWALSPDGSLLALESSDGAIELWDVSSRKHVATIDAPHEEDEDTPTGYDYVVASLAFSPDGRLLATGGTRWTSFEVEETSEVRLWNVSTGEPISAPLFGSAPFPPAASGWQR